MEESRDQVLPSLPVFPSGGRPEWQGLRVEGLVLRSLTLSLGDLRRLPQELLVQDFRCEEGWVVPEQRWEGVRLANVLKLSEPSTGAKYVALSAGEFAIGLTLEEAMEGGAMLALKLNGEPIAVEHGGPCRLVVPGKTCYYSVKWVDRVQVLAEPPEETGKQVALERIKRAATVTLPRRCSR